MFVAGMGRRLTRVHFDSDPSGAVAGRGEDLQDANVRQYKATHNQTSPTCSPAYTQARNAVENRVRVPDLDVATNLVNGAAGLRFWTGAMRLARKQITSVPAPRSA